MRYRLTFGTRGRAMGWIAARYGLPLTRRSRARPLELLGLALEGLQARARDGRLDSEEVERAVTPLVCLVSDMDDAMRREHDKWAARRAARGEASWARRR